jgi:hypothetical protein
MLTELFNFILSKKNTMSDIQKIIDQLVTFRDERNWKQFHNSKDLSLAISIEAAELNDKAQHSQLYNNYCIEISAVFFWILWEIID